MDGLINLLCCSVNCPKRACQVCCYCDQCNSSVFWNSCCFDKLYCIKKSICCCKYDFCKNNMGYEILGGCCQYASICCMCAVPVCAFSVICCNFNKINFNKYYDSVNKTLLLKGVELEQKYISLTVGDIPFGTEIVNFKSVTKLDVKSKKKCGGFECVFPSSVKKILNFSCISPLEEIILPENLEVMTFYPDYANQKIPDVFFPKNIKKIAMGYNLLRPGYTLPENLNSLTIGNYQYLKITFPSQ